MRGAFVAGLGLIATGGVAALGLHRRAWGARLFAALVLGGCGLLGASAVAALAGDPWDVGFAVSVPGGAWSFGIDALSAFFLLAIAVVGGASAVYGVGYLEDQAARRPGAVRVAHATVAVLIVALALTVTARAVVPFLIAWESMAVAAFVLVMFDHDQPETRRAGLVYLVATHAATLALIAMFASWGARDLTFASLADVARVPGFAVTAVLVFALAGFGVKSGLVPLHFWLPGAHAAAPSHVSALMSGLVIKMGIYGLLRVAALLGGGPAWFGWTLLAAGAVSGVLGVVWALAQHDLKRLLAYHSVENIGIILLGMGAGTLGVSYRLPAVAALGYAGAVLHVLNHALFKGLLFLGAGSVAHGAGTRRIDALGGLARRMPLTWVTFLVASAAIVGLPPLNGFVSEWTVVRALLGAGLGAGAVRIAVLAVAALGLIGGLALACFAKVGGVAFLGHPRTEGAAGARESGPLLTAPMIALAGACVAIGLAPALVLRPALAAAAVVSGAEVSGGAFVAGVARLQTFAWVIVLGLAGAWLARRAWNAHRVRVTATTWSCGYPLLTPRMQYTSSSFAAPVLEPFGRAAGIHAMPDAEGFASHPFDLALEGVLAPGWRRLKSVTARASVVQGGRLHIYLLYVFATVVLLLAYLALRRVP